MKNICGCNPLRCGIAIGILAVIAGVVIWLVMRSSGHPEPVIVEKE
jgi:hypothetical protein